MITLLLALTLLQEPIKADQECMDCHVKQTDEWRKSVHAKHDTGCISCHKSDAVNPKAPEGQKKHAHLKGFLTGLRNTSQNVCVQCHEKQTEEFKRGPHWDEDINASAKWNAKKRQGCLSCHEPHGTLPADRKAIYEARCTHCHKETGSQRKIFTSYMAAADPFDTELTALKKLLEHPLPGVPYAKAEQARDSAQDLHRLLRTLQHNCEFKELEKKIAPEVPKVKAAATEIQGQYDAAKKSRRNYFFGFLGLMVVNLVLLRAWCIRKYRH